MRRGLVFQLVILAVIMASCSTQNGKGDKEQVRTVKLETVTVYGEKQVVSFPGKVKASDDIRLAFRISGTIQRIYVKEGSFVRQGQVLAEIDPRDYRVQLSATEAEYNQVKGDVERIVELYKRQSVTQSEHDKAIYGLQQIEAKYNAHKNALNDTKLKAPFDGYVQKRLFDSNETVSAGMPVISMISAGGVEVEINIPATNFIEKDKFESYSCTVDIYSDKVFPLELVGINQKANMNQLYTMQLKFKDTNATMKPTPGMSTMVNIQYKHEKSNQYSIPVTALFENDSKPTVWVYSKESQTISARAVQLSEILTNGIVVVSGGLSEGEQVVAAGVHSIKDGEKVLPLEPVSSTNIGGLL